ncbi:U3 snoRNP-associated protein-like [Actinidia chinensis var. chinensis]|uniref:U3 snoRNP-associated protein-like n=1 Tax=Actinidia chinensis var. chinensis TaxID=1590841 RepID=A0A2R6Q655_ACTCC|nr:U3 snoRNP-associated protein-like [Actinidia chinensis var. chinensis]
MRNTNLKRKKASVQKGPKRGEKGFAIDQDPFFDTQSKRRRKIDEEDDIESSDEESDQFDDGEGKEAVAEEEDTAAERRKRVAEAYLEKIRRIAKREQEEDEEERESDGEREGERDSLVAQILQQEQMEESGRARRLIASRVQKPETTDGFRVLVKHRQSVNAVALSEDDAKGFSASKDGTIVHWDVDSGKAEKYLWPSEEVLRSHGAKDPKGKATKHSKHVLSLAVSSDGRYLASGGLDRQVHLWDIRTREHIQAFPGHQGPVSCLTFRQGTSELFSGSFDRTVKIWNAEDRAYINTLFGHQGEVINIDCLRKERVLTVGRDRSMHLFKVPEESRLVFRAPASSLECCCFINNDEFLSGSDDGSIEHWSGVRKKPVHIVKNAHALVAPHRVEQEDNEGLPNGHIDSTSTENGIQMVGNYCSSACSWVNSVIVCRSSDLATSGAGNGFVRLWEIESDSKGIRPLFELPLVGFVNSLAFAKSGHFLVAGVGQEPRLGRWGRIPEARNGVAVHSLKLL